MPSRLATLAAAAASFLALAPGAQAQSGVSLGALSCASEGSTGFIIGSSENLACTFTPANADAPSETYVGTLETFGLDIGVTGATIMEWVVLTASADAYAPGVLAGRYAGASANGSVVAGAGVNLLVGGPNDGFTLQPLSLQAQQGINAAIGVTTFTLQSAIPVIVPPVVVVQ